MRDIELASWHSVQSRVESIRKSLEMIYSASLHVDLEEIPLASLYPTEEFLENDKLSLVFMKIIKEGYDVPIVAVEYGSDFFVLDGHHRTFLRKKLGDRVLKAYVLRFPESARYRMIPKNPFETLPIREISVIDDPILRAWQRTLNILKEYEALYNIYFHMKKEQVSLESLVPTQPYVLRTQVDNIKELLVPITCIPSEDKYYILDGHARAIRARQYNYESIEAIALIPAIQIDFGIVKTAKETGLRSIDDIDVAG